MVQSIAYIVASITPAFNERVQPDTDFVVVFREHMDKDSLNTKTIFILDNDENKVPLKYDYNEMKRTLVLTPTTPLDSGIKTLEILTGDEGPKTFSKKTSSTSYTHVIRVLKGDTGDDTEPPVDPGEEEPVDPKPEPEDPKEPDLDDDVLPDEGIEGFFLQDSYPSTGDVRNSGEPVVLIFTEEISSDRLLGQVYINKKPLHRLLAGFIEDERIVLQPKQAVSRIHSLTLPEELIDGSEAELVLSKELMGDAEIRIPFQQNWSQLYANPKDVRLVLGLFGNAFSDADLARLIHRESVSAYQIMLTRPVFVEDEWDNKFPYAAGQYVIYKTAYQAILGQVLESGSGMRQSMSLGDFQVAESESTSREIKDLIGLLKDEVDRWWKILNGVTEDEIDGVDTFTRLAGSATRGVTESSYPDFITRVPFQDIGE